MSRKIYVQDINTNLPPMKRDRIQSPRPDSPAKMSTHVVSVKQCPRITLRNYVQKIDVRENVQNIYVREINPKFFLHKIRPGTKPEAKFPGEHVHTSYVRETISTNYVKKLCPKNYVRENFQKIYVREINPKFFSHEIRPGTKPEAKLPGEHVHTSYVHDTSPRNMSKNTIPGKYVQNK